MCVLERSDDMKYAAIKDLEIIQKEFYRHKDIFPHIRADYLRRSVEGGDVIFKNNVIIIFTKYKRTVKLGDVIIPKGDYILHQILSIKKGKGNATKVFVDFLHSVDNNVWLTVRKDNEKANRFYTKNGMSIVGNISWANKSIEGYISCILFTTSSIAF